MVNVTDAILSGITGRAGLDTIRRRMYELNNPSPLEITADNSAKYRARNKRVGAAGTLGLTLYTLVQIACGGGRPPSPTEPSPTPPGQDTTPPTISNVMINGRSPSPIVLLPSGTARATLEFLTNEAAICRYSENPNDDYNSMPNQISTSDGISHRHERSGLWDGLESAFNIKCADVPAGNITPSATTAPFRVATEEEYQFKEPIVDLLNGNRQIPNGNLYVAGLGQNGSELEIPWSGGELKVKSEHGLRAGQTYSMRLVAPGYKVREFTGRVPITGDRIEVDLGGGRTEYPVNMIPASFNEAEYANYRLRVGHSQRPVNILPIGVLDKFIYVVSTGNTLTRGPEYDPNHRTLKEIREALIIGPRFCSGGMYPLEQVAEGEWPSYVKVQSKGHSIPETNSRQPGWVMVYPEPPESDSNPNWRIHAGDSGTDNITYGFLGFRAFIPGVTDYIGSGSFIEDLCEILGARLNRGTSIEGKPREELFPYFFVSFARPVRHTTPDNVVR